MYVVFDIMAIALELRRGSLLVRGRKGHLQNAVFDGVAIPKLVIVGSIQIPKLFMWSRSFDAVLVVGVVRTCT